MQTLIAIFAALVGAILSGLRALWGALTGSPGVLAEHPWLLAFLVTFVTLGGVYVLRLRWERLRTGYDELARYTGTAPVRQEHFDAEDHLRGLRIAADEQERTDWGWGTPGHTSLDRANGASGSHVQVMVTAQAAGTEAAQVFGMDERTAELVVDPTLRAADVAEMVEHIRPGAGSVAEVGRMIDDTRLRDETGRAIVALAELEACAEAPRQDARLMVNAAFSGSSAQWGKLDEQLWRIAPWVFYAHDETDAECAHCAMALSTVSGEYRALTEHTQEIDRNALRALLAA